MIVWDTLHNRKAQLKSSVWPLQKEPRQSTPEKEFTEAGAVVTILIKTQDFALRPWLYGTVT